MDEAQGWTLPPALTSAVETAITAAAPALQPPLLLTDVLTDELLLQILGFLEAEELARAALACKPLARLCREDELWPPLCRRAWRAKQNAHAFADALQAGEARRRVISECHFAIQLNHFITDFLSYSVAFCRK